ncbi:hypothetical protein JCM3766R1_000991 [Sporobolomyces carnicolor]
MFIAASVTVAAALSSIRIVPNAPLNLDLLRLSLDIISVFSFSLRLALSLGQHDDAERRPPFNALVRLYMPLPFDTTPWYLSSYFLRVFDVPISCVEVLVNRAYFDVDASDWYGGALSLDAIEQKQRTIEPFRDRSGRVWDVRIQLAASRDSNSRLLSQPPPSTSREGEICSRRRSPSVNDRCKPPAHRQERFPFDTLVIDVERILSRFLLFWKDLTLSVYFQGRRGQGGRVAASVRVRGDKCVKVVEREFSTRSLFQDGTMIEVRRVDDHSRPSSSWRQSGGGLEDAAAENDERLSETRDRARGNLPEVVDVVEATTIRRRKGGGRGRQGARDDTNAAMTTTTTSYTMTTGADDVVNARDRAPDRTQGTTVDTHDLESKSRPVLVLAAATVPVLALALILAVAGHTLNLKLGTAELARDRSNLFDESPARGNVQLRATRCEAIMLGRCVPHLNRLRTCRRVVDEDTLAQT